MLHPGDRLNVAEPNSKPSQRTEENVLSQNIIPGLGLTESQAIKVFDKLNEQFSHLLQTEAGRQLAEEGVTGQIAINIVTLPKQAKYLKGWLSSDGTIGIDLTTGIDLKAYDLITVAGVNYTNSLIYKNGKISRSESVQADLMGFRVTNELLKGKTAMLRLDIAVNISIRNVIECTFIMDLSKTVPPEYSGVDGYKWSYRSIQNQVGKVKKITTNSYQYKIK